MGVMPAALIGDGAATYTRGSRTLLDRCGGSIICIVRFARRFQGSLGRAWKKWDQDGPQIGEPLSANPGGAQSQDSSQGRLTGSPLDAAQSHNMTSQAMQPATWPQMGDKRDCRAQSSIPTLRAIRVDHRFQQMGSSALSPHFTGRTSTPDLAACVEHLMGYAPCIRCDLRLDFLIRCAPTVIANCTLSRKSLACDGAILGAPLR